MIIIKMKKKQKRRKMQIGANPRYEVFESDLGAVVCVWVFKTSAMSDGWVAL